MGTIRKILVTGASGFVGCRTVEVLENNDFEVLAPSHKEFDITSADAAEKYIKESKPDAILHLAAISNTGYCEEHPEESYLVNVVGVENLARISAKHEIKMVFFSVIRRRSSDTTWQRSTILLLTAGLRRSR